MFCGRIASFAGPDCKSGRTGCKFFKSDYKFNIQKRKYGPTLFVGYSKLLPPMKLRSSEVGGISLSDTGMK